MAEQRGNRSSTPAVMLIAAAVWIVGFLVLFFQQTLPNNAPITRGMVWDAIALDFVGILNPFDYSTIGPDGAGWGNLWQRLPFAGTAATLIGISWIAGRSLTRRLPGLAELITAERLVIDLGTGISLFTLWVLGCGLAGFLNTAALIAPTSLLLTFLFPIRKYEITGDALPEVSESRERVSWWWFLLIAPFALHIFLGGFTPPFDFDVREYHLQGPREWFEAGRIFNLDHNVYTTFPFLSEMLSLAAMVLMGDKWEGAIAGKVTLTTFQFLSVICTWGIARRWCGSTAAVLAALIVVSTPWTTRISIIAYAEGAISFYIISSAMTALLAASSLNPATRKCLCGIAGFLAGSAMASKYPGIISSIIPVGLFLLAAMLKRESHTDGRLSRVAKLAAIYTLAVVAAVGPWLLKNAVVNHNPVYPLAYGIFGGRDWSPEMDAKWKRAHSSTEHDISQIPIHLWDVTNRNDWQSGLVFALAIPGMLLVIRRNQIGWLSLHAAWILFTWWALTHRIDRFWVPVIPILGVVAGAAWQLSDAKPWKTLLIAAVLVCSIYNYGFVRLSVVGFHAGLAEMSWLKEKPVRSDIATLNKVLPPSARVLMVGEAEVFDANFSLVYNTVFDDNIFEDWTAAEDQSDVPPGEKVLKTPDAILQLLRENQITHIFVNWSEVLRYRLTYGFTKYVTPSRLNALQMAGILSEPQIMSQGQWSKLNAQQQGNILSWQGGNSLREGEDAWNNILLYRVIDNSLSNQ